MNRQNGPRKHVAGAKATKEPDVSDRFSARRNQIVDTAARLFAEGGYDATGIQELSEAVGLQRGALYHYIDGKKDLLFLIHQRFIEPLLQEVQEIESRGVSSDEALREIARSVMKTIKDQRDQVTVFLHEWKVIRNDKAWKTVQKNRRKLEALVEDVLERGIEEGEFVLDDVHLAALAFFGMINFTYQWFEPDGQYAAEVIADQFADIFLNGIRSRS